MHPSRFALLITASLGVTEAVGALASISAQSRPPQPVLGGGAASNTGPNETRCIAIAQERAGLAREMEAAASEMATAVPVVRAALQRKLATLTSRDEQLATEQSGCAESSSSPSGLPGAAPPLPPGGLSGVMGLPGAPAPGSTETPPSGGMSTGARGVLSGTRLGAAPATGGSPGVPWGSAASATPRADGLTPDQRRRLCAEKFATYTNLRNQAPLIRTRIAEGGAEVTNLKRQQDYIAMQISILEESMSGINGCNPQSGLVADATPPPIPAGLGGTTRRPDAPAVPNAPPTTPPAGPAPPAVATSAAVDGFSGRWKASVLTSQNPSLPRTIPTPGYTSPDPNSFLEPYTTMLGSVDLRVIDRARGAQLAAMTYGGTALGECRAEEQYYEGTLNWEPGGFLISGIRLLFSAERRRAEASWPLPVAVIACASVGGGLRARFQNPPDVPGLGGAFMFYANSNRPSAYGKFNFRVPRGGTLRVER